MENSLLFCAVMLYHMVIVAYVWIRRNVVSYGAYAALFGMFCFEYLMIDLWGWPDDTARAMALGTVVPLVILCIFFLQKVCDRTGESDV